MIIKHIQIKKNLTSHPLTLTAIVVIVAGVLISPTLSAFSTSYDSFHSTQITKVGTTSINVAAVKGKFTIYSPQISSSSDHRDTMVYLFHAGQFTLGAGYQVSKPSGSLVKNEMIYYYKDSGGFFSHYLHSPFTTTSCVWGVVQQVSSGSSNWKATVRDCNGVDIFFVTFTPGGAVANPTPAATARALSVSASGNTLPSTIDQLTIGYWSGTTLAQHLIDSGVTVSDYKCASEGSTPSNNWYYNKISNYYKFTTGPGVAGSDNCAADNPARKAPGE